MTTKFDIGELVHIKAVVNNIEIRNDGKPRYTLWVDKLHSAINMPEEYLTKIEDDDQPMGAELRKHYKRLNAYYNGGKDEPIQDTIGDDKPETRSS